MIDNSEARKLEIGGIVIFIAFFFVVFPLFIYGCFTPEQQVSVKDCIGATLFNAIFVGPIFFVEYTKWAEDTFNVWMWK